MLDSALLNSDQKIYRLSHSISLFFVQAAFRDNTVGLPKLCPPENIGKFNSTILQEYMKRYYQPSRIVIAGVNVDHQHLVDLTNDYFVNKSPMWHREGEATESPDRSIAQYTGGIVKVNILEYSRPFVMSFSSGLGSCWCT